ncbi:MAG: DMT family transporter [Bacteroidetes bacterium]|nr:DMT family transporter [Bacteroidota bacterium]
MERGILKAHGAMLAQNIILGLSYQFASWASVVFHPAVLLLLRSLLAGAFFLVVFSVAGGWRSFRPTRRDWWAIIIISLFGIVTNQLFFVWGLRYTSPASSSILYACTPMLVLFLAAGVQRIERFSGRKVTGTLLALCGVVVIILLSRDASAVGGSNPLLGNLLTLVAMAGWAGYIAFSRPLLQKYPPMILTSVMMIVGAIGFLPVGLYFLPQQDFGHIPANAWYGLFSLVVLNSAMAYFLILYAMQRLTASQAAVYINLQPIVATLFSIYMTGHWPKPIFYLGALLILGGIFIINYARSRPRLPQEQDSVRLRR